MTPVATVFDEDEALAKWLELAPLLDRLMERADTDGEFPVGAGSSLAGDDQAANPYQVSHVVQACLVASIDHLHALKVLVVDKRVVHIAAPASLARGALEALATAYWVLHPALRDERVTRSLRWHAKNIRDANTAAGGANAPGHPSPAEQLAKLSAVATKRSIDPKIARTTYTSTEAVTYADTYASELPLGVLFPWRLCSGFAHGRPWAILGFSDREVTEHYGNGVVRVRLTNSLTKALYPTLAAIHLMEKLLHLYEQRAGTPFV